jgi:hypothetical protein
VGDGADPAFGCDAAAAIAAKEGRRRGRSRRRIADGVEMRPFGDKRGGHPADRESCFQRGAGISLGAPLTPVSRARSRIAERQSDDAPAMCLVLLKFDSVADSSALFCSATKRAFGIGAAPRPLHQ